MCTCGGLASGVLRYDRETKELVPQVVCDQCARVLTVLGRQAYDPLPQDIRQSSSLVEHSVEARGVLSSILRIAMTLWRHLRTRLA